MGIDPLGLSEKTRVSVSTRKTSIEIIKTRHLLLCSHYNIVGEEKATIYQLQNRKREKLLWEKLSFYLKPQKNLSRLSE